MGVSHQSVKKNMPVDKLGDSQHVLPTALIVNDAMFDI